MKPGIDIRVGTTNRYVTTASFNNGNAVYSNNLAEVATNHEILTRLRL